ncbi:uncharacterized protein K02A2.6-like [Saccostrea cucullata]|uniref:uncharacterized protein K02A2.6-like n=1 Tax=Saccostrea cuccullata TaxID=36930 RepID=UPI002ED075ED
MTHIGKVGEFNESTESFANYVERLEQFFAANEVKDQKKVAVFLSIIGPTTYGVLKNLVQPALPKEKEYKDLVQVLRGYYMPKPLVISERFKFNKRNQKEGESVYSYVIELKRLSTHCEFGEFLPEALRVRDRLVCGLRSEAIQKKLLSETELDFDKAVKIAYAMETAEKDTLAFLTPDPGIHSVETKYSGRKSENRKKFQRQYSEECYRCGNNHNPKEYDETSDSSDSICSIFCTNEKDHSRRKLTVNITVGDEEVEFLIDTGSVRTIVGEAVYQRHLEHFKLTKTDTVLRSYTGDEIGLLGVCHVPVKYQDQEFVELPLLVAQGQRPSLLGRDWLSKIKLNWQEVFAVRMIEMETLRREYSDLFLPSTEPIKDFKAQIRLKEDGHPIFCKACTVPYAIKEQVENELRKLVERGVLQKVKNSSWAAPVVVVPKADQSVRICGDYKMTVNRVISEEHYPLPNTDDMFASLAGGKKFTKLDLSQAYSQLELDRESQECLTINTHLGLFRYARLPYGVSSASAIFQSVMDQVLLIIGMSDR